MTYIIAEPCIDIKDLSCVDVCPVDCIHEFDRILVIDPEECIDCFAPNEEFFTPWGLRTFVELENSWTKVLTDDGFKPALIKRFRRKPLVELEFAPAFEERDRYGGMRLTTRNISRYRRTVRATPTHSWVLADGDRTTSLDGWVAADGDPVRAGSWRLRSIEHEALAWLAQVAPLAGYVAVGSGQESNMETNYGRRNRPIRWLYLATRETYWRVNRVTPLTE